MPERPPYEPARPAAARLPWPPLGHQEHQQRLLLALARADRTALGTDLLEFGLHAARRLLGGRLLPLYPVELSLQLTQFGAHPGVATGHRCATTAAFSRRPQLVVLLDETGEFALDLIQEGVDLLLVVAPLADGGLLERDVVDVGRGQRHRNSS